MNGVAALHQYRPVIEFGCDQVDADAVAEIRRCVERSLVRVQALVGG